MQALLTKRLILYISNTTANINIIQEACSVNKADQNGHLLGLVSHTPFWLLYEYLYLIYKYSSVLIYIYNMYI